MDRILFKNNYATVLFFYFFNKPINPVISKRINGSIWKAEVQINPPIAAISIKEHPNLGLLLTTTDPMMAGIEQLTIQNWWLHFTCFIEYGNAIPAAKTQKYHQVNQG